MNKVTTGDLTVDLAKKMQMFKGYEVGYSRPNNGKIIVNFNGQNFLMELSPLETRNEPSLENAMDEYNYLFK